MFPGCAVNSELMQEFTSGWPATEIDKENAIFLGYLQDDFKNKKETFIPASEQPE